MISAIKKFVTNSVESVFALLINLCSFFFGKNTSHQIKLCIKTRRVSGSIGIKPMVYSAVDF